MQVRRVSRPQLCSATAWWQQLGDLDCCEADRSGMLGGRGTLCMPSMDVAPEAGLHPNISILADSA